MNQVTEQSSVINDFIKSIEGEIQQIQTENRSLWLSEIETYIFLAQKTNYFLDKFRIQNNEIYELVKPLLSKYIRYHLGKRSGRNFNFEEEKIKREAVRMAQVNDKWRNLSLTEEEKNNIFFLKAKERILEDSHSIILKIVDKIKHLVLEETDHERIALITQFVIESGLATIKHEIIDFAYSFAKKLWPEISLIITNQILSHLI